MKPDQRLFDRLLQVRSGKLSESAARRIKSVAGYAARVSPRLTFNAQAMPDPEHKYVIWLDLLGAGHLMSTSMLKSANSISRLHLAVEIAAHDIGFLGSRLAINDGIFIVSESKSEAMAVLRESFLLLGSYFLANSPLNRWMVRASIAYGPVYTGEALRAQLSRPRREKYGESLSRILFGPPVIQAYRHEHNAAPFGVALHESARSFCPPGAKPFVSTQWGWWTSDEYWNALSPYPELAEALGREIVEQLHFLEKRQIFYEISAESLAQMRKMTADYFFGADATRPGP